MISLLLFMFLAARPSTVVSWQPAQGAETYSVFRSAKPGLCVAPAYATGLTETTFTDNAVILDHVYYYSIQAVNGLGATCSATYTKCEVKPPLPHNCSVVQ